MDFKKMALAVQDEVVAFRRDLHEHPESSMKEFRTTDQIAKEMDALGIPYKRFDPTGLVAIIEGGKPGKTVALRADIDALEIEEKTGLPFASKEPGKMHACGHDTHAAMLVGCAKVLSQVKDEMPGTVKLVFQPAEEVALGAKLAIAQGALENVDSIFGIHIGPTRECGSVYFVPGASHAATDEFKITITGKATHGARPEAGVDATVCAAAVVMNLQTIVSREVSPSMPLVVTVGSLHSGSRFNIVSGEAVMTGTVRCYDYDLHHSMPEIFERIVKNIAAAYRCEAKVEYNMLLEPVVNNDEVLNLARKAAAKIVDTPDQVKTAAPGMGGEDFGEYSIVAKAAFASLGCGGEYPAHSDHVVMDESAFPTGVALYCQVAWDLLAE